MAQRIVIGGKAYFIVGDAAFTVREIEKAKARYFRLKQMQARQE